MNDSDKYVSNAHVNLIVAICKNNGIGKGNMIPWRIRDDLSYFSKKTSGYYGMSNSNINIEPPNAVIMGRKTWESLPKKYKPLPNRFNIILSNTMSNTNIDKVAFFSSIGEAMSFCYSGCEKGEKGEKGEKANKSENENDKKCIYTFPQKFKDIWVIGGSSIYKSFIDNDNDLYKENYKNISIVKYYITYIDKEYECDTFFPLLDYANKYHLTHFEKKTCSDDNADAYADTSENNKIDVYYIVFKKIKYNDDKIIDKLFIPYNKSETNTNTNTNTSIHFYIKKTNYINTKTYNFTTNELNILFSIFGS